MSPESIEPLVRDYGYGVILIGTYFDHYGIPLFLVFGGIAASQDLLNPYGVLFCGFAGGWIADLFLYFLGYKTGLNYWLQFGFVRKLEKPINWTQRAFKSHPVSMVILGRFLFVVSKIIPPFAGMIHYDIRRYILYSFIGNILFSVAYTFLSLSLGNVILDTLNPFKASIIFLTLAFIAIMIWITKKVSPSSS
ncbi:MAG: DedA family protein [Nitrospina sp.]|jgi:membrane protein DedA with SNARE-associated domain|nr:DedA family protein [Nitrospina sp.]